jgi:RHS repeat-associated protein
MKTPGSNTSFALLTVKRSFYATLLVLSIIGLASQVLAYDAAWNGYREDITKPAPEPEPDCGNNCPPDKCNNTSSPVYSSSGSLVWVDRDIIGVGGLGIKRTYNSFDYRAGIFGRGWISAQEVNIARTWRAETEAPVDGSSIMADSFTPEPICTSENGRRYVLEDTESSCNAPLSLNFTFEKLETGYKQVFDNSTRYAIYNEDGKLVQQYSDTDGSSVYYQYDVLGRLIRQYDSYGFILDFVYNEQGFVEQVTDQANRRWQYSYDDFGRLIQVLDPEGNSRDYGYREIDNVGYSQHLLTSVNDNGTDPVLRVTWGNITINSAYASAWRVTSYTESDGLRYDYSYSNTTYNSKPATKVVKKTYQVNSNYLIKQETIIAETATSLIVSITDNTDNLSVTKTYNERGKVATQTDKRGNITSYEYDNLGRKISITELAGTTDAKTIAYSYLDNTDRVTVENRYNVLEISYSYDSDLRIQTKTVVDLATGKERIWQYSYQPNSADSMGNTVLGKLAAIDGPQSGISDTVRYSYDASGQLTAVTNALGSYISYTYDNTGQVTTVTDPNGIVTEMLHNSKGQVTQTSRNGLVRNYVYNGQGQVMEVKDERGNSTKFGYNDQNRIAEVIYPAGDYLAVSYSYQANYTEITYNYHSSDGTLMSKHVQRETPFDHRDLAGFLNNTNSQTYHNNYNNLGELNSTVFYGQFAGETTSTTKFDYDQLGRLESMVNGLNGTTQYEWDIMDRLIQVTDPNNAVTSFFYNAFGDKTEIDSADSGNSIYDYDQAGNLNSRSDGNNKTTRYSYDAQNRVTAIDYEGSDRDVTLSWDEGEYGTGKLTEVTDGSGKTSLTWNRYGRLDTQGTTVAGSNFQVKYSYDEYGQITNITYPSGLNIRYIYDEYGGIEGISKDNAPLMSNINWLGQLLSSYQLGNGITAEYFYDTAGRLIKKQYGSSYSFSSSLDSQSNVVRQDRAVNGNTSDSVYQYDKDGHLVTDADSLSSEELYYTYDTVGNRSTQVSSGGSINETYYYTSQSNRLASINGFSISQDAAGNILDDGIRQYTYDATNRLDGVVNYRRDISATYTYNFLNQRVRKQLNDAQSTDIRYVYGQYGELLGEYDYFGNRIKEYVYNTAVDGIPDLIAQIDADDTLYYIHTDHLDTPRAASDENQVVVWSWLSDAFGRATPMEDVDGDGVLVTINHRFPGQYYDYETGLLYNWHRYYDPETGRYISTDPIGLDGGINLYAYVEGNPVNWMDPWGLIVPPKVSHSPQTVINNYSDALEHWRSKAGGSVPAGATLIGRVKASSNYISNKIAAEKQIEKQLKSVPCGLTSGVINRNGGLIGINVGDYALGNIDLTYQPYTVSWATTGTKGVRQVTGVANRNASFNDEYVFKFDINDPVTTFFSDTIPSIVAGDGAPFFITGSFSDTINATVSQCCP